MPIEEPVVYRGVPIKKYLYLDDTIGRIMQARVKELALKNVESPIIIGENLISEDLQVILDSDTISGDASPDQLEMLQMVCQDSIKDRILQKLNLGEDNFYQPIFFNLNGNHWVSVVLHFNRNDITAHYTDSLYDGASENIESWLTNLVEVIGKPTIHFNPPGIAKQKDLTTCGAFAIENALMIITSKGKYAINNTSEQQDLAVRKLHVDCLARCDASYFEQFKKIQVNDRDSEPYLAAPEATHIKDLMPPPPPLGKPKITSKDMEPPPIPPRSYQNQKTKETPPPIPPRSNPPKN